MGEGDVIKSFLVGLGFDVDEKSLSVFNKSIKEAAVRVTSLYGAVVGFAGGIVYAFSKISQGFEQMGYQYHILAPTINKLVILRNAMMKAYSEAGIHIRSVIAESFKLNMSFAKTKFAMEAIYKSVASRFFGVLLKQSDEFRKHLVHNMPYIVDALTKFIKVLFTAFGIAIRLGERVWSILGRVYGFFADLHKATKGWSTILLGVVAAWKLLNLSFLATPLGMIIAGLTAILALYDDFETWKEGGKSFFNWAPVVPIIDSVKNALMYLFKAAEDVGQIIRDAFTGNNIQGVKDLKALLMDIWHVMISLGTAEIFAAKQLWHWGGDAKNWIESKLGMNAPLGSQGGNTSNLSANMQTNINISASPSAAMTARLTADHQQHVNRDMVRNLKGVTR